jgi:hypothetical protein
VKILAYAWSLPGTLLGLVLSLPCRPLSWQWRQGVLWIRVGRLVFCPRWVAAITLGCCVLHPVTLTPRIIVHELQHARQWQWWGLLFGPAYGLASLWALLNGRNAYVENAFEVDARRAEEVTCPPRSGTTYRERGL